MTKHNYYVEQEADMLSAVLYKKIGLFDEVVVVNADQEEASLLLIVLGGLEKSLPHLEPSKLFTYSNKNNIDLGSNEHMEVRDSSSLAGFAKSTAKKRLVVLFNNHTLDQHEVRKEIKSIKKLITKDPGSQLIVVSESYINEFRSDTYYQYSEEEYAIAVDQAPHKIKAKLALDTDRLCEQLSNDNLNVQVLRYSNLFGPTIDSNRTPIYGVVKDLRQKNEIHFNINDRKEVHGYSYISDILLSVAGLAGESPVTSIFNITSYNADPYTIKTFMSQLLTQYDIVYSHKIRSIYDEPSYYLLQTLKIKKYKPKLGMNFRHALEHTYMATLSDSVIDKIEDSRVQRLYNGKLDTIRKLEVDILKDVDRICKKHDIKYFLIGGSMLGAIRHKGFIPWDDDLDIGFLRKDYDKFRKIAIKELDKKFYYQTYRNKDGSHYVFDKIRVKGTTFSTAWSALFDIEDGVFLDVLVFDKTSNIRFVQQIHTKLIRILKRLINLKWINYPRKKVHYRLSVIALPFVRLIPFPTLHKIFEGVLGLFEHSKNSKYVIDSVGMNIEKGGFPLVWLQELTTVKFEGSDAPVSEYYDEYLKLWYGEDYMKLLPPNKRTGHAIVEINLGEYGKD